MLICQQTHKTHSYYHLVTVEPPSFTQSKLVDVSGRYSKHKQCRFLRHNVVNNNVLSKFLKVAVLLIEWISVGRLFPAMGAETVNDRLPLFSAVGGTSRSFVSSPQTCMSGLSGR